MLQYVHELPPAIQGEDVTHASVGRTIIDRNMLHAEVAYGTLNAEGEFEEADFSKEQTGVYKLVIPDMKAFLAAPSTITELPDSVEDLLQNSAAGLASYADAQELWPGL